MSRIINFEGRQISVPDDATEAEVAQILGGSAAPPLDPNAGIPVSAPTMSEKIMAGAKTVGETMDTAAHVPRGARSGLANIAGLPVDAMNWLVGALGGPTAKKPVGGSKFLDDALGGFGLLPDIPPAKTPTERVLRRTGEEIGAASLPVGAAVRAGEMGVQAARKLPLLARMFVEPAAINPTQFASRELATAAAAGTGAGLANEATNVMGAKPGDIVHNTGDIAGALTGATTLGVARTVGPHLKSVAQALNLPGFSRDKFSNDLVKNAVVDQLANNATVVPKSAKEPIDTVALVEAINRGTPVSEVIPGFKSSLADVTRDPGLAAMEYQRQTGPNGGFFSQQRNANTTAVDDALQKSAPTGTPGALRSELEAQRETRLAAVRDQTATAQTNFDQHIQRLQPAMTGDARGADIRAALENASDAAKDIVNKAWAPLNQSKLQVDMKPLADDFGQVGKGMSVAERERFQPSEATIPKRLSGEKPVVPERLGPDGQPVTEPITQPINEVTGLRSALSDAAREATTNGRANEARIINQHISALDDYLDQNIPTQLRQDYDAARKATVDYNDRFTRPQTAIAQTLDRREGLYSQPNNAIAQKFVQDDTGRIADFQALMRETGNDQRVVGSVRDQILADVRDRGLLNNPQQLDEYLQRYNTILSDPRFNSVRQELTTAGGLRGALDSTVIAEQNTVRQLGTTETPGTGPVGQYLRFGDEKSEAAMKGILASKNPGAAADELLNFAGNKPEAVEGARKVFWDILQKAARRGGETTATPDGKQPWMPKALKSFLDEPANKAVAERLYRDNPEHLANINKIADALQGVDLRNSAKVPNTSGTAQGVNNVLTPETLQSRFYAYKRGQTSLGFMVTALASVAARRAVRGAQTEAIEKLLDRALLDPDLAKQLLTENNPANRAAMNRTAKAFLGNEASTIVNALADADDQDPVRDAVMRK